MENHRFLEDTTDFVKSNDSDIVRGALRVYGSTYAVCITLFAILRLWKPKLYQVRSWSPKVKTTLPTDYNFINWLWKVFQVPDAEILDQCGMDAVCFLRALRFGRKLSICGCIIAVVLIPVYHTAEESEDTAYLLDPFQKISMAHLPSSSKRYIATAIAAYVLYFYTMHLIFLEFRWYTAFRHKFLSDMAPRNYAVYVSGIPPAHQSSEKLQTYFSQISRSAVLEAHICMDTPKLDKLVKQRAGLMKKLEHAVEVDRVTGRKNTQYKFTGGGVARVETVREYRKQIMDLTRNIQRSASNILGSDNHMRAHFNRDQSQLDLLAAIHEDVLDDDSVAGTTTVAGGTISGGPRRRTATLGSHDVILNRNNSIDEDDGFTSDGDVQTGAGMTEIVSIMDENGTIVEEKIVEIDPRTGQQKFAGFYAVVDGIGYAGTAVAGAGRVAGAAVAGAGRYAGTAVAKGGRVAVQAAANQGTETLRLAQHVGTNVITGAGAVVPILVSKGEGSPKDAGFVVFRSLYATQTALQMIHHPKPYVMNVAPVGEPEDIFWRNVGLPHNSIRSGVLTSLAATVVLCFFWSVPMAAVSSMTEVKSLKESWPKLADFIEDNPSMEKVFAQIAPMILLFFNEVILPYILKYFATWEGHISSSLLEDSVFVKLGWFMIIQTFFISAISGGLTAEISNILRSPERVIDLLANSLPGQSSFFIQISLAMTFVLQSIEMLRIYPLGIALLRRCFGPRLTEKERQRPWGLLRCVGDPPDFWHAETFAQLILFYMVLLVYTPIAPVTCFFLLLCFLLSESGYRYQFINNYPRAFDTGGRLWKHFITFTLVGMIMAQVTLIGVLALKQSRFAGPGMLPLLGISVLFIFVIHSQHSVVADFLPTRDCILKDSENNAEGNMDMSFVKGKYLQPSLQDTPIDLSFTERRSDDDEEMG